MITEAIIGEGVTSITSINSFAGYDVLRRVSLPSTLTSIPAGAFRQCKAHKSIVIPDAVTSIGRSAFESCDSLRSVTIGSGVTQIQNYAFKNCAQLMTVRFKRYVPDDEYYPITMSIGYTTDRDGIDSFYGCADLVSIVVPEAAFETYRDRYHLMNSYAIGLNYANREDVPGYSHEVIESHIQIYRTRTDRDTLFAVGATNVWRTWCDNVSHAAPKGAEVYTVNCVEDRMVKLNKITATVTLPEDEREGEREGVGDNGVRAFIPAFVPVLIKRASGEVTKPLVARFVMGGDITPENGWTRIQESHTTTSGGIFDAELQNGSVAMDMMPYRYTSVSYGPVFNDGVRWNGGLVRGSAGPNNNYFCGNVCNYDPEFTSYSIDDNTFTLEGDEFKRVVDVSKGIPMRQFVLDIKSGDLGSDTESPVPLKVFNELALADNGDNTDAIATAAASGNTYDRLTLSGRTLYKDGLWNTLCLPFDVDDFTGTPLEGATVKTLGSSSFSNGTLNLNFTDNLSAIEAGKPYLVKWSGLVCLTINNDDDWNTFVAAVANGNSFAENFVRLDADINVSTMVGSENRPFCGTFEGNGHTLNVSIDNLGADYAAPFRYINGATIRNVKVTGSVNGGPYCAGIVGAAMGGTNSIRDCWMNANVTGQGYIGGVLGHGTASATTISNCYMDGTLRGYGIGVFCGWGSSAGTHTAENCWSMGDYYYAINGGGINLIQTDGGMVNITDCCHNSDDIQQGVKFFIISLGGTSFNAQMAQNLGSQWTVDENDKLKIKPSSAEFTLASEIVNPTFKSVAISDASVPVETGCVDFIGTFDPVTLSGNSVLYLGTNNNLYYPSAARTIGAFRAYFELGNGLTVGDPASPIKEFKMNFGNEDGPDGTGEIKNEKLKMKNDNEAIYNLAGQRLSKPQKGINIVNGRKILK
ncbi:MAG: leucine-rich repeat domain-containing protein [Bacteroidaceae bacterium]|nr:leucine-rich repeat domain-containing protein [Bacteroidaceae bacterium]